MKIDTKHNYYHPSVAVILLTLAFACLAAHILMGKHTILIALGSLLNIGGILWGIQSNNYYKVSYEIRDDGIYLLRNDKVRRFIPYTKIKTIQLSGESIRITRHDSFRLEEILRPESNADKLMNEIEHRIAEHGAPLDPE